MIINTINIVLLVFTGIATVVKLLQVFLNPEQKVRVKNAFKNRINTFQGFDPFSSLEDFGVNFAVLIEVTAYFIFITLVAKFVNFPESLDFEILKEFIGEKKLSVGLDYVVGFFNYISDRIWLIIIVSIILTIIRRFLNDDFGDMFPEVEDYFREGTYLSVIGSIIYSFLLIVIIFVFYYYFFGFLKDYTIDEDSWIDILLFGFAILMVLLIPFYLLYIIFSISISIFLFVTLSGIHLLILSIFIILKSLKWIFDNPKKNWAILAALFGALGYVMKFFD
jgi:hypothetical protein